MAIPTHTSHSLVCRQISRRRTTSSPCSGTQTATQHLCVVQQSLLAPAFRVLNAGIAASTPVVAAATQQATVCVVQEATAKFQALQRVYDVLSDPQK